MLFAGDLSLFRRIMPPKFEGKGARQALIEPTRTPLAKYFCMKG